jgi:stage V sporulation protein B
MTERQGTLRNIIKPAAASVVMGVVCLGFYTILFFVLKGFTGGGVLTNDIATLITIPFGAAVYFIILARTGTISSEDIAKFPMGDKLNRIIFKLPFLKKMLSE